MLTHISVYFSKMESMNNFKNGLPVIEKFQDSKYVFTLFIIIFLFLLPFTCIICYVPGSRACTQQAN